MAKKFNIKDDIFHEISRFYHYITETLRELNLGRCNASYSDVLPLNIVSSQSFTRYGLPAFLATHFVGDHMERALSGV
jgi:hypothetical protein